MLSQEKEEHLQKWKWAFEVTEVLVVVSKLQEKHIKGQS